MSKKKVDSEAMAANLREAQANGTSGDQLLGDDKAAMKREAAEGMMKASEVVTVEAQSLAPRSSKAAGLILVVATGPGGISPDESAVLIKSLEALGHVVACSYAVDVDDGEAYVPDTISNISHIMDTAGEVGVLLCPDWSTDPASRAEVFAAINMDRKLYALGLDGALVQIDPWAAVMTLASHPQFQEAVAIYAPLPKPTG